MRSPISCSIWDSNISNGLTKVYTCHMGEKYFSSPGKALLVSKLNKRPKEPNCSSEMTEYDVHPAPPHSHTHLCVACMDLKSMVGRIYIGDH